MAVERPTMKAVAEAAGVSIMTVSRALRDQHVLPEATRKRIQKIARELGYRPDPMVSTLMSQLHGRRSTAESPVISYVTAYPQPGHWKELPYNVDTFNGAAKRAAELGYSLEHFCITESGMTVARANRILRNRGVVGMVLAPLPDPRPENLDFRWEWFASATVGYSMGSPMLHRAMVDHQHAMRLTYQSLWEVGYRRIGLALSPTDDEEVEHKWISGFTSDQFYHPIKNQVPIYFDARGPFEGFKKWFDKHKPDAVITVLPRVVDWIYAMGCKVPDEVGIAMPSRVFKKDYPELAGVDQHNETVGAITVDLVVEQLHHNQRGVPENSKVVMVQGHWEPGRSIRKRP